MTPVWAMLAAALAQSEEAAPAVSSGWEWWAAGGGGAAALSGGGVILRKMLSVLALESKVDATEAYVSGLTDAIRAQDAVISDLRGAISKVDDALDDIRATMAAQDVRITAADAPSEAQQQIRERLARMETRHDETTRYLERLNRSLDSVRDILSTARGGSRRES